MAVMAIFLGIFTTAFVSMAKTANQVRAVADTSDRAASAFLRLDREIRYASDISTPTYTANTWHVEFLTNTVTRSASDAVSNSVCTQLAVTPPTGGGSAGALQQRTWTVGDAHPSGWTPLVGGVMNYAATDQPFPTGTGIAGSSATSDFRQLTLRLVVAPLGLARAATDTTTSKYTVTALNSTTSTPSPVCQQFPVGGAS